MAKKLYGTDPDQVPTNADLGGMAYMDPNNMRAGDLTTQGGSVELLRKAAVVGDIDSQTALTYTAPTVRDSAFTIISVPTQTMSSAESPEDTVIFKLPTSFCAATGMIFLSAENSGVNVAWSEINYFYHSNGTFTVTELAAGSSQGTSTFTLSQSGQEIIATMTYAGGLGGNIRYTIGGFVQVCNY